MLLATKLMGSSRALTFVASATGVTSIASMPAHQAGDLLVAFSALNSGGVSGQKPTLPSGWTSFSSNSSSGSLSVGTQGGYKIATSDAETSGTWTGAEGLILCVYRNSSGLGTTNTTGYTASSLSVIYASMATFQVASGTSFAVGLVATETASTVAINTAPTGMVNRNYVANANLSMAFHDTNQGVTNWGTQTAYIGTNVSDRWVSRVELKQA